MTNPYALDQIDAAAPEAANANPYSLPAIQADQTTALRGSLVNAVQVNPDQAARANALARQTGAPADVIQRNLPEVEQSAAVDAYSAMISDKPVTRTFLSNPQNAAVAHDDTPQLSALEKLFGAAIDVAKYAVSAPGALDGGLLSDVARASRALASGAPAAGAGLYGAAAAPFELVGADTVGGFLRGRQRSAQGVASAWMDADPNAGLVQRGVMSGLQSAGQSLITLPLGFASPGAMLGTMGVIAGGASYGKARDAGLSPARAIPYAVEDATAEVVTERFLGAAGLLKQIKAGATAGKLFLYELLKETPGEVAATLWQNANEYGNLNPDKSVADFINEQPAAIAETIIATLVGGTTQIGAVSALRRATGAVGEQERKAQAAEQGAKQVEQLAKVAADSKLRARDPDTFRQFIEQASEAGTAPKEVFIDQQQLANVLNQSGVTLEQLQQSAPSVAAQFDPANLVPGADVRIPMSELLAADPAITGALVDHLRTTPDAMSRAEAQQYLNQEGLNLQAAVETEIGRTVGEAVDATRSATVRQHFDDQLAGAGRFTPAARGAYSLMLESFYSAMGARTGQTGDAFLAKYPLNITGSATTGAQQLNQGKGKAPRATLSFNEDPTTAPSIISLGKGADLSSVLHESGHHFLNILGHVASEVQGKRNAGAEVTDAERQIAADAGTIMQWLGVTGTPTMEALQEWLNTPLEQKRSQHEQFARGVERYFAEGTAPSTELQSVFDRFRSWLLSIYKNLANLKADITPDVRAVFDRLLASDEAIRTAEAARNLGPLFTSAEAAGMTAAEFEAYQALGANATATAEAELSGRLMRDMRWQTGAKAKALKEAQAEATALRAEVELEVAREVMAEPVFRAHAFLTGRTAESIAPGTIAPEDIDTTLGNGKLRTALVKEADERAYAELRRLKMTNENGMHPDVVAEIFGFTSGDQLVQALAMAGKPEDAIQGLTDQRMLEKYGDISSPDALQRAAERAVMNETRARVIATELKAVATATNGRQGSVDVMSRAARDFAAKVISGQRIRDVRPGQYAAAATRAAKQAQQSLGDLKAVAMHKRAELVNIHAARAASDAQREIEAASKYLNRAENFDIPSDYREQIESLLERFDIRKSTTLKAIDRRKSLAQWVDAQRELGRDPDISEDLLNEARRVSVRDLTVAEFRELVNTIRTIEHLGRTKQRMLTAKDNRDFDQVRTELVDAVTANAQGRKADVRTPKTTLGKSLQAVKNFSAAHVKVATYARVFDGGKDGGPWWERVIRPVNEAGNMEVRMKAELTERLHTIMAPLFKGEKMGGKGRFYPSIGRSLNREERLSIALNWGNASNRQRLTGGENWTEQQVQPVLDTITAAEWQAVQQVWDLFESLRPLIGAKEKRVFGTEPEWIDPAPFETANGGLVRGGYYPVTYDSSASIRAEEHANAEEARAMMKGAYNAATTRRSFTKSRAEEVYNRPLLLSFQGLYGGLNAVVHDLAFHEVLIDLNRLLRSDLIDGAVRSTFGPAAIKQFAEWRNDIAQGDAVAQKALESALGRIRQNVSFVGLGYNVISAATQITGVAQSIARVGPAWFGVGLKEYIAAPIAKTREASAKSEFMASRSRTRFRELNELRNKVQGQSTAREVMLANGYVMMMRVQQVVDVPTWHGAYAHAIADGRDEATAVQLADQAVIDAQGGGGVKDLSAIERGGPALKVYTSFYSFMNTALNILVARGMTHRSAARSVADFVLIVAIPSMVTQLLKDALVPGDAGDDDEGKLFKKLLANGLESLFGLMVLGREFGEAAKMALGVSESVRGYQGPSGLRMVGDATKLAQQVNQGDADLALVKAAINVTGDLVGLPAAQINRSITGAAALAEGDTSNPAAVVFGYQKP